MNPRALVVFGFALLCAFATPSHAGRPLSHDGLVAVPSRDLDELYLRPDADLASYRKVMIDPVRVEFDSDWLRYSRYVREVTRPVGEENIRRITDNTAADMHASFAEAFKARGYEIVAAPGPGVLRLTPSVEDLYVNAPDRLSPWRTKTFTREAGQAVLLLEARDAASGTLLARVVHHGRAEQMGRVTRANDVSNRFWFDALFGRWAANCVAAFEAGPNRP